MKLLTRDFRSEFDLAQTPLRLRSWDRPGRPDVLKHLFEEFALWTAFWTGFPVFPLRRESLTSSQRA